LNQVMFCGHLYYEFLTLAVNSGIVRLKR
jgi:hypothetical protein